MYLIAWKFGLADTLRPNSQDSITDPIALGLGVFVVAAAPLLTVRELRRMDRPSTLRVME